jgi:hypothetical protein
LAHEKNKQPGTQKARLIKTSDNMIACGGANRGVSQAMKFDVLLRDWTWYSQVGFI